LPNIACLGLVIPSVTATITSFSKVTETTVPSSGELSMNKQENHHKNCSKWKRTLKKKCSEERERSDEIRDDWKYVAMVIDRLLLLLFFGITLGGTLGIICSAPHVFDFVDQEKIIKKLKAKYTNSTEDELLTVSMTF
uniref:Neur_chan_memb domain-containing protein n=1 Tax=Angiostrongylus cantonensis TaxID=6313 RepID=A0A158PB79_ANGCA